MTAVHKCIQKVNLCDHFFICMVYGPLQITLNDCESVIPNLQLIARFYRTLKSELLNTVVILCKILFLIHFALWRETNGTSK